MTSRWRALAATLTVVAVVATGCANVDEDAAIDLITGFGGEPGYDPCEADDQTQCAATQVAEEIEQAKESTDLMVDAFEAIGEQDYEAARTDLGRAILLRPGDRELHGYRIAVDVARGGKPTASDLATFSANRDPLAVRGDLALIYGQLVHYLVVTDGAPEAIRPLADGHCTLAAFFMLSYDRVDSKDRTTELTNTYNELEKQRSLESLQNLNCKKDPG